MGIVKCLTKASRYLNRFVVHHCYLNEKDRKMNTSGARIIVEM